MNAAFFDVDGTLTTDRVWRGLMDYFRHHRLKRLTHLRFRALHYPLYFIHRAGLISESAFRTTWAANLAWYLQGTAVADAAPIWDWVVERHLSRIWRADVREILERHKLNGSLVVLVSSGPQPLIERIAVEVGADQAVGTRLETRAGRYTGRSLAPVCIDEHKAELAQQHLADLGLPLDLVASYAYADSASDRQLLEMVGYPVAVYPNPALRELALEHDWLIFPEQTSI